MHEDEVEEVEEQAPVAPDHESPLVEHARNELAYMLDGDPMNQQMYNHLIHMVTEFANEKHSGFTAAFARQMLDKLFKFEPIKPLTGEADEWTHVGENMWQNKRCSRVFCDEHGNAHDIEGRVFVEPDGIAFTSNDSCVPVVFPYTPEKEYVYLSADSETEDPFGT